MKKLAALSLLSMAVLFTGCSQESSSTESLKSGDIQAIASETIKLPEGLILTEAPADIHPLYEVRAESKTGDEVAFTGYIGGRVEPFTEGRGIFLVTDVEKAPQCFDDGCPTPWDACCTPKDDILANNATVQVLNEKGLTLKMGLEGVSGLVPGANVAVTGNVREKNDAVFIVDATSIAILSGPPEVHSENSDEHDCELDHEEE